MDDNSDNLDDLDTRRREPVPFYDVVKRQDAKIAECGRRGITIPDDILARMKYVESVLFHGNCSGRDNPTITLPTHYKLSDIEAVIGGPPENIEPGSDAAWRAVRRRYDARQSG